MTRRLNARLNWAAPLQSGRRLFAKALQRTRRGIQYVAHTEGDGGELFEAVSKLGLDGIVSKKLSAPYCSGPSRTWVKVKNPAAPAATRAIDGGLKNDRSQRPAIANVAQSRISASGSSPCREHAQRERR